MAKASLSGPSSVFRLRGNKTVVGLLFSYRKSGINKGSIKILTDKQNL